MHRLTECKNAKGLTDTRETEVSRVEDREFAICYQKLIAHYRQTPEESKRQLAGILQRISEPEPDRDAPGEPP